jgi:chitinase
MMNGRSDSGEYFYQSDFQTVLTYAENNHLGRYTFWDVNRDRQCNPPDNNGATSSSCSSVPQNSWDFTKYTTQFAGATPPTTVPSSTPSASPTGGTGGGTCTAPAWNSSTAYNGGAVVSYNGHQWTAKWWTQGDIPGNNSQNVWTDNGACTGGGNPSPSASSGSGGGTCTAPAWVSTTAYNGGAVVSYNGHKWTAKWWTQGDIPGNNAQNVWTDNGAC